MTIRNAALGMSPVAAYAPAMSPPQRSLPTSTSPRTARRIAFDVLTAFDESRPADAAQSPGAPHVTQLFDDAWQPPSRPSRERPLATELVYGIVRRRATLAAVLAPFLSRPRANIEAGLWRLLELGVYQLVLTGGIPPHAAVSETVSLAREIGKPQWSGFLNGVLRSVTRELTDDLAESPSRRGVPLCDAPDRVRYRLLAGDLFADPSTQPAEYLAAAFSFPDWLIQRWMDRTGFDETLRLAAWSNSPGRMTLRVNPLRGTREALLAALQDSGCAAAAGGEPYAIRLPRPQRVEDLPGFQTGAFSVQDESAQQAARLLAPQPGEAVLDLCAAPGGKATHLAELMLDRGRVLACDIHAPRLQRVVRNAARLGLNSVETLLISADSTYLPAGPFDAALVDVPCSNTGVLGKRPDARWRITPADLLELPRLQRQLLQLAVDRVRPGGRVLYSTCSVEPAENQQLVGEVLAADGRLQLLDERQHVPGQPGDGGYQALLVKQS